MEKFSIFNYTSRLHVKNKKNVFVPKRVTLKKTLKYPSLCLKDFWEGKEASTIMFPSVYKLKWEFNKICSSHSLTHTKGHSAGE